MHRKKQIKEKTSNNTGMKHEACIKVGESLGQGHYLLTLHVLPVLLTAVMKMRWLVKS